MADPIIGIDRELKRLGEIADDLLACEDDAHAASIYMVAGAIRHLMEDVKPHLAGLEAFRETVWADNG